MGKTDKERKIGGKMRRCNDEGLLKFASTLSQNSTAMFIHVLATLFLVGNDDTETCNHPQIVPLK